MADLLRKPAPAPHARKGLQLCADACHVALSIMLWALGNLLVALGAALAFAIVAADARPHLFLAHLENLASHYLAAGAPARAAFDRQLLGLFGALWALFMIARMPGFAARLSQELKREASHG